MYLRGVELRQLRVFVAVADEGSFTLAADRLHVVQSAVSAGVRTLERELGARLFDRTTRQVQLSDAGRVLLPEARRLLAEEVLARELVQDVRAGLRGSITIGTMQAQGMRDISVAELVAEFHADHPAVQIRVRHAATSAEMADQVRDGRLDLAFLSLPNETPPGLVLTLLTSEAMMLAAGPGHRLAGRKQIDLTELQDEPFADGPQGWGARMASDWAFALARAERTVVYEMNDLATMLDFVRQGLAVALIPAYFAAQDPEVSLIPIRHRAPIFNTYLATARDRRTTAATNALVQVIHEHVDASKTRTRTRDQAR
ncbi:MAG TPA: LysR family transcriptional regulator [Solirubrobacteraceae bacterium]|nr:LysR family transcriptional regulator [Solirubrobacteraceae bacterium]